MAEAARRLPSAPDPAGIACAYLRARRARNELFGGELFADPAWDMLLDLYLSTIEGRGVCISDACIAAGIPSTTALRCLGRMEECGLVARRRDEADARRVYVELMPGTKAALDAWLEQFAAAALGFGRGGE